MPRDPFGLKYSTQDLWFSVSALSYTRGKYGEAERSYLNAVRMLENMDPSILGWSTVSRVWP